MATRSGLSLAAAACILFIGGVWLGSTVRDMHLLSAGEPDHIRKLEDAYAKLSRYYVEDLDRDRVVERGIEGMISALDPHSTYIPRDVAQEVREEYEGSFGGVGLWYEIIDDTARVSSTIDGGPSEAAGVQAGDRIIRVENADVTGDSLHLVQKLLKGPARTNVRMTVLRRGIDDSISFEITRDIVPIFTIPAALKLDESTGYIKINQFAITTAVEFENQLQTLIDDGIDRLILDLRNNPGGIMESAVSIADHFLPEDRIIVQTKGRDQQDFRIETAGDRGLFEDKPLIVLVNEFSASASEIIAGALQDNDRALVIGRRTFGKALVQQEFVLPDGSLLHLTVSRYYTPSGRLIQTPYEEGSRDQYFASKPDAGFTRDDILALPDSLRYETTGGRVVAGDGGILPDVIVGVRDSSSNALDPIVLTIMERSADVAFSRNWFAEHEVALRQDWQDAADAFDTNFDFDGNFWDDFYRYLKESGAAPTVSLDDIRRNENTLSNLFKARIAQQLYGTGGWYRFYSRIDPVILRSQELWSRIETLLAA